MTTVFKCRQSDPNQLAIYICYKFLWCHTLWLWIHEL